MPNYRELMGPALEQLEIHGSELSFDELLARVAETLLLDPTTINQRLTSGRETLLASNLRWALTYLSMQGKVRVSEDGQDIRLLHDNAGTTSSSGSIYGGFSEAAAPGLGPAGRQDQPDPMGDELGRMFRKQRRQLKRDLLAYIHARDPEFFEALVIDLLVAMGYARRRGSVSKQIGGRGDGGVDGVIYQDALGLDFFYIQAKRYKPSTTVPIAEVRDFAGSLEAHKANKGVFVTTARLPQSATDFVEATARRIMLIDGDKLTDLMISFDVGVKREPLYIAKELDPAYFSP